MKLFVCSSIAFFLVAFSAQPLPKGSLERGKKVYENNCLSCHMADGSGVPALYPPLKKNQYTAGDPAQLVRIVLNGLEDEIKVNGEEFSNPMPSQAHLGDQEIADVLTYVRNSFGNKGSAVSTAMVAAERKKMKP